MTVAQWAERYRYLSAETSELSGRFSFEVTPYLRGILEAITDRRVRKVVCRKSAQIGWTDGVMNNFIGYAMHVDPGPMGVMFPRDQNAKDYNVEKFGPMVEATPVLAEIINTRTRTLDNTQNRKKFPGGFLKLFGSNSTGGVKSTPLKRIAVEEPDDCNLNIKGQGDSIKLAEERVKTFYDSKVLVGGTPTTKGACSIDDEIKVSDQRVFEVPCHDCGSPHALSWDNVKWQNDEGRFHAVFGHGLPDTAEYACPHCGSLWNDGQKNRNVRHAEKLGFGWRATADFNGVAGFSLNELYSPFQESRLRRLVEKYLTALHEAEQGDDGALIVFWNSSVGESYEFKTDAPDVDALEDRAEEYAEFTIPWGGLVLTAGVDVQHDRLAVSIYAWGRGEEDWLIHWGEIHGQTMVPLQGAWLDLEALLSREFEHVGGAKLRIRAGTVDTGDGTATQDAAYAFCRKWKSRGIMAGKGGSEANDERREIFAPPKPAIDADKKQKAWKYGLRPFIVGTSRAKDLLIDGRLKLAGIGPGRAHWYKSVRPDWYQQITSEIKAPHRSIRGRKVWQKKSGVHNEGLDTKIYAFHAARSLKLNLLRESGWRALETAVRQRTLIQPEPESDPTVSTPAEIEDAPNTEFGKDKTELGIPDKQVTVQKPVQRPRPGPQRPGGFSVTRW
jgi:phage terminase large subunit GpA-like protein